MNCINKVKLILLMFVPFVFGFIMDYLIQNIYKKALLESLYQFLGDKILYIFPIVVGTFWFWVGMKFSKTNWNFIFSVFISHIAPVLSIFIWFFLKEREFSSFFETLFTWFVKPISIIIMNLFLIGVRLNWDMYHPLIIVLFYFISFIGMILLFVWGYLTGKKKQK